MRVDRQLLAMAAYGFVSGLPLPLSGFTFRLWLSDSGAGLAIVGLTAWIGLAYSLKFLWAPLLDQPPPLRILQKFGRRRGWLLLIQPMLGLAAVLLALSDPAALPIAAFAAAACVAVLSATQDIAIDAWRIEVFPERRQGVALAAYVWGYRVAMSVSTTGVIAASASIGWHQALLGVAVLIACGTLVTLAARREDTATAVAGRGIRHAVIDPVRSFLARPSSLLVVAFVALFKLGEAMAGIMTAPFYLHLTFDKAAIATTFWFSLGATLAGYALGGWLVARIGVGRALLWTGSAQTMAMAMYVLLSVSPGQHAMLYATVTAEAFAQGMADAAFLTFLSALCAREFAATQYALLSSVPMLAIHTVGAASGVMAASLGWTLFYTVCMAGALPGMALMLLLLRRQRAVP
ncbi:MAG: transporter, family, beta-lactamase induction signal transducer AmpG [Acetobacteraceae bacterium]|nr:transporter, family, beta-lactamase induction signal transducer AmpG [Acetobacteraceae bacterium]